MCESDRYGSAPLYVDVRLERRREVPDTYHKTVYATGKDAAEEKTPKEKEKRHGTLTHLFKFGIIPHISLCAVSPFFQHAIQSVCIWLYAGGFLWWNFYHNFPPFAFAAFAANKAKASKH